MWHFFNKEQYQENVYSLRKIIDKKVVAIYIIAILSIAILAQVIAFYEEQERIKEQIELEKEAKKPKLTEVGKENIRNIYEGKIKKAFLTFDDGPSNNTRDILDILKERKIKATFFVLGSQVEYFPETTNRIYNEGHFIANHGYSHRYKIIYQSPEMVLDEYNRCNQLVANTIGVSEYNSHLFRFPGGSVGGPYADIKNTAITLLDQNNITYMDWNSLTGDSEIANPTEEYLMNNLQQTTNDKQVVVVLMHDSQAKRITVDCLPKVIDYLSSQGYEFDNFYSIIK